MLHLFRLICLKATWPNNILMIVVVGWKKIQFPCSQIEMEMENYGGIFAACRFSSILFHCNWFVVLVGNFILNKLSLSLSHLLSSTQSIYSIFYFVIRFSLHSAVHCTVLHSAAKQHITEPIKCSLQPNDYVICESTQTRRVCQTPVWMLRSVDSISFYLIHTVFVSYSGIFVCLCSAFVHIFSLSVYLPHICTMCEICLNFLSPWIHFDNIPLSIHVQILSIFSCYSFFYCRSFWPFEYDVKITFDNK